jgi:hypothetical protein
VQSSINKLSAMALFLFFLLNVSLIIDLPVVKSENGTSTRLIQVQYQRREPQEQHLFLNPNESVTYNASDTSDGLRFVSINVLLNSTNPSFLREVSTDLYIESYAYFGGLGAWTSRNNFTLTNPTASRQELFLKIVRNYVQTTYCVDNVVGNVHTIQFTSGPAADRVFVRWGVFAALKLLEVNGSAVDVLSVNRNLSPIMLEYLPNYASFHLAEPLQIQGTRFVLRLEERGMSPPSGFCYISAFKLDHKEITLGPNQEFMFDLPKVDGWGYVATTAYTNLTASLYPQPYPFELINMAVWDPTTNPMLTTMLDTAFGVRNLSNETYSLSFDILYYYWQNQTELTFSHEIIGTDDVSITHEVLANVSSSNIGAEFGLTGQYIRFLVDGKILRFDAPDSVGKYEGAFIPLKEGSYILITKENKLIANMASKVDDLGLSNKLIFNVTYNGDPFANAEVTVTQAGTFTSRVYNVSTDQNGEAVITVYSNGPESDQLSVKVSKDEFNFTQQTISYTVGASWIAVVLVAVVAVVVLAILFMRKRRKPKVCD